VAVSHIGPDLTHLASRKTLISGVLPKYTKKPLFMASKPTKT